MKHMKKVAICTALAALMLLTSCGLASTTGNSKGTAAATVKLTVMSWVTGSEDDYAAIAKDFTKQYPNISFTYQTKPFDTYFTMIDTLIQSGQTPDLFPALGTASTTLSKWANEGAIAELGTDVVDPSQFLPYIVKDFEVGSKLYQYPAMVGDYDCVLYNKDLFTKNNISLPKSQADFESVCDAFLAKGITPLYMAGKTPNQDPVINVAAAYAPTWNDNFPWAKTPYTDPAFVGALQKIQDWISKGYFGKNYQSIDDTTAMMLWSQGKIAMRLGATYNFSQMKAVVPSTNIFFLYRADGSDPAIATPSQQYCLCLNAKTQHKDEAIILMKYLESPAVLTKLIPDFPAVPLSQPASKDIVAPDPVIKAVADAPNPVPCFMDQLSPVAAKGADIWTIMSDNYTKLYFKQTTPLKMAQALETATDWSLVSSQQ